MTGRRWWPLLAVVLLLVAVAGAAAVSTPQLTRLPVPNSDGNVFPDQTEQPREQATPVEPSPAAQPARTSVPGWVVPLLVGVLLTVVVALLLVALRMLLRGRTGSRKGRLPQPTPTPEPAAAEQVVAAVDAGLSDLSDTDLDPRRAVIACWVRLEQVAAAAGTPRRPADTPTDLVARLLSAHSARGRSELASPASPSEESAVDPGVLAAFAGSYRLARYATHTVDEQMRDQARAALQRLRAELTGVAV